MKKAQKAPELEHVRIAWILGYSYQEIADRYFGGSVPKAQDAIHNHLGRASQYALDEAEYDTMRRLYDEERWTVAEIAEEYGVGVGSVRYHLARKQARMRRRGWNSAIDPDRMDAPKAKAKA